ncbi:MAG: hypothetical protein HY727_07185 [Candidatus Rokubacteria bacterium]|nr:hypothetical protein [Candidatus Rokubacteria bacterium]
MPWAKIDDDAPHHPKFVKAGSIAAFGFWVAGNCYCNKRLTDGFIEASALRLLSPTVRPQQAPRLAQRLVSAGLWEAVEGGFRVHDFHQYNPTSEQVKAERNAAKERKDRWRERRSERSRNAVPHSSGTLSERRSPIVGNAVRNALGTMPTRARLPVPDPIPPTPLRVERVPATAEQRLAEFEVAFADRLLTHPQPSAFRAEVLRAAETWPSHALPPKATLLWFRDGAWHRQAS